MGFSLGMHVRALEYSEALYYFSVSCSIPSPCIAQRWKGGGGLIGVLTEYCFSVQWVCCSTQIC